MTTPKDNKGGAKEVTTPKNNETKPVKTEILPKPKQQEEPKEQPKAEEKATETTAAIEVKAEPQPKSLEEQINYFLGMEKLVTIVRRLETHLEAVNDLIVEDQELEQFENETTRGAHLELYDSDHRRYTIKNPRLVKEMLNHLQSLIEGKITEYNSKILTYSQAN